MRRWSGLFLLATALAATTPVAACASSASPEKTGTETFGCYVGSCVSPGGGGDDDASSADGGDGGSDTSIDAEAPGQAPSSDGGP